MPPAEQVFSIDRARLAANSRSILGLEAASSCKTPCQQVDALGARVAGADQSECGLNLRWRVWTNQRVGYVRGGECGPIRAWANSEVASAARSCGSAAATAAATAAARCVSPLAGPAELTVKTQ
eukprot:950724-Pyramimonas_sp.AAC.1